MSKRTGRNKEKCNKYASEGRRDLNKLRKEERRKKHEAYLQRRNERLSEEIKKAVDAYLTGGALAYYNQNANKKKYCDFQREMAENIRNKTQLPLGKLKRYLHIVLDRPALS